MQLEKIGKYWNERAEGYSLSVKKELTSEEQTAWVDMLSRYAPREGVLDCLDIGCGPGFFSVLLASFGNTVTGIDFSQGMLDQAEKLAAVDNLPIEFMQMDAQNLDFADESFDYIVSRNLTWNLENPEQAYKEWMRVLRPGGRILIYDGNYYLHYYSKEYANEIQSRETQTTHRYMLGVDTTPIDTIARELPLSREFRPAWDISCLIQLGACNVQADVKRKEYVCHETGKRESIIDNFVICLSKDNVNHESKRGR